MDYFGLGSKLDYPELNALVYLLRKFKKLTSDLRLGSNRIESDYGTYNVTGGLTSVGGNFILEDDVTIISSDVLLNCFYTFNFTVVDVNLSGTVNRRVVSVTGDTGDNGELSVVLSPDLLESDEVILPEFKVDIVFDEHEYYTPVSSLDITLEVDKSYISVGEVATVTATVLDGTGSPVEDLALGFNINGSVVSDVTDEYGVASVEYMGTGVGWVNVSIGGENVKFYDGEVTIAEFTGNSITLGYFNEHSWLPSVSEVIIDWGDGTTTTVNNPTSKLTHSYTDGVSNHDITFIGTITSLGNYCFTSCTGLTSVTIPSSVTSLGKFCFDNCIGLTSVTIPSSVTSLGFDCFYDCTSLIDYQLYWTGNNIITYDRNNMPNNTNTIFTIPQGETANYTAKGYPTNKLVERGETLTLTSDKTIIQTTETSTITATLKDTGTPLTSKTLNYQIKHGSTIIDSGTDTTDNNGQISISYTGTGIGDVDVIVSYSSLLQEIFIIQDCDYYADSNKISTWNNVSSGGTQFKVSSYSIGLSDFSVEMKFNTIDAQIMVGNQSSWLAGVSLTDKNLYTHSSSGETVTQSLSTPIASDVWRMEVEGTTIRLYRNNNLYTTKTNCKVDYPKTLRLYPQGKSASVDYVKVKAL